MQEQQHSQPNISTRKVHRTAVHPLFLALLLANGAQAGDVEPSAGPMAFRIEPQSLDRALVEFSAASGQQVVVDGKLSTGVHSPGVSGSYTPRQALDKLLEGTGVAARVNRNGTVTLEKAKAAEPQSMAVDLPKVTVSDTAAYDPTDPYDQNYAVPDSFAATKTDTPIMETPVSIQVVPRAVMDDQQVINVEDATRNVSGIQHILGDTYSNFLIRGFDNSYNGLIFRNGYRLQAQTLETAHLESIEVLKGPASVLYGRIEPGGLVNVVTKKPLEQPYYSVKQQFGSYDLYRTTVDATGPILADESLLYRVNLAYQDNQSFRDFVNKERVFVAPSLSWHPTEATEINLNIEFKNEDRPEPSGIPVIGDRPASIPTNRVFNNARGGGTHTDGWLGDLNWSYRFNDSWTIRNGVLANIVNYTFNNVNVNGLAPNGTLSRGFVSWDTTRETKNIYLELAGKAEGFGLKHKILVGGDYFSFDEWIYDGRLGSDPSLVPDTNIFDPRSLAVNFSPIRRLRSAAPNFNWHISDEWFGLYVQDQITAFDKLHILMGGRYDWAETASAYAGQRANLKDDTLLTDGFRPRFGILYRPLEGLSIYANYVESLGANNGRSATGVPFSPQQGEQYEAGLKAEALDGRLNGTLAFFHIVKDNLLTADPNFPGTGIKRAIGEARSQGIEVDLKGQITENMSLITTYAFIDATITKDTFNKGRQLPNVPKHSGSLWAKYDFAQGFSVGTGAYIIGQRMGDTENTFQLPGYVRWDAMAAYRWHIGRSTLTTQVNIYNILDKTYYTSSDTLNGAPRLSVFPGEPLTVLGSVRLEY